tara:strand:+ start:2235 stop:2942 length:708 start_codon:yes stop_codon:yes gene_type:complete
MLKYKFNKDEFDGLSDELKALYSQDGENYILQAEGIADKSKLDEFRANNTELMKKNKQFEGVDLEKYNALQETERKLRDKELTDAGKIDTLISEKTAALTNDFNGKLENMTNQMTDWKNKYDNLATRHAIDGEAQKAFVEHKIRPEAQDGIMAQIKSKFSIDETGVAVGRDGDKILSGSDGNLTIGEFVSNQPDFMRVPNSPGGGNGGGGGNQNQNENVSSVDKIASGLKTMKAG